MFYKFITLGCKVNSYESAAMSESLEKHGYFQVANSQIANVVVINTCSVTSVADSKSRQMIRREIKNNPHAIICAVGCYAQLDAQTISNIPGISIVIGTKNRLRIGEYIERFRLSGEVIIDVDAAILSNHTFEDLQVTSYFEATRAYLKIQDGCNNFCSYCIIPYARGPLRSRNKEAVMQEAKQLIANGYKEIVLTGIHTGGYGEDLGDYSFSDLLVDLCAIDELKRIRISSIEEGEIDDTVINALKRCSKIVPHLHIPLQSGCDITLKRMNRKYTTTQYAKKVKQLRQIFPTIAITSDVIVGFPGETEEEFQETLSFVNSLSLAGLHVFPFSPRQGTPAATMPNQVPSDLKKQRVKQLIDLATKHATIYAKIFQNEIVDVLFETYNADLKQAKGHASNYLKIQCDHVDFDPTNQILSVELIKTGFPVNYGIIRKNKEDS